MLPLLPASLRRKQEEEESEASCALGENDGGEAEATKKEVSTEVKRGVDDPNFQVSFILIHDIGF